MAKRAQKIRKTPTGEWVYFTFSARPEEIRKYRELAAQADRSLSWWIRDVLNKALINGAEKEQDNEKTLASGEGVSMEKISAGRPRSDFES